ncbi:MAG: hypothetical protein ACXABG_12410 [Promethearchaeota archaeon]|jgi:hypothetical protein
MLFQSLSESAKISGMSAFISVSIAFLLGFIVLIKYIKTRQVLILSFFLCIIFTTSPWWPSGLGFFFWVITGEFLTYQIYVISGTVGVPIAILAWLNVYTQTLKPNRKKLVLAIYGLISIFFEIYLFYFLIFAPGAPVNSLLGIINDPSNPYDIDFKGFVLIFLGLSIITACITGFHFALNSMKKEELPEIRWKGRFLFVAFLLFGVSAIFDAIIEMDPILLVIMRILLVVANFLFYLGFILPSWSKKLLSIKEEPLLTHKI